MGGDLRPKVIRLRKDLAILGDTVRSSVQAVRLLLLSVMPVSKRSVARGTGDIVVNKLGKALADEDILGLKEVVGDFTGRELGATFFRGNKPIDGVWASEELEVVGACVMPVGYGVGDHRLFVIDFSTRSVVGKYLRNAVRPASRRLNTRIEGCRKQYNTRLEDNIQRHRLREKIAEIEQSDLPQSIKRSKLDRIDQDGKGYMRKAEKKCRRIKSGRIPFSPEASIWIRRAQCYRSILRYHNGQIKNRGNLKRTARRVGIRSPLSLSVKEIQARLAHCKEQCEYFRKHGKRYRRRHLEKGWRQQKKRRT